MSPGNVFDVGQKLFSGKVWWLRNWRNWRMAERSTAAPPLTSDGICDPGSNSAWILWSFLQFLENFQTLRANYRFGRSWAIEGPFLIESLYFRPNLSLGLIHVVPRGHEIFDLENGTFYYVKLLKFGSEVRIPHFPAWFWGFFHLYDTLNQI